jgi:hypothetical protein
VQSIYYMVSDILGPPQQMCHSTPQLARPTKSTAARAVSVKIPEVSNIEYRIVEV